MTAWMMISRFQFFQHFLMISLLKKRRWKISLHPVLYILLSLHQENPPWIIALEMFFLWRLNQPSLWIHGLKMSWHLKISTVNPPECRFSWVVADTWIKPSSVRKTGIQATSVASEKVFSTAVDLVSAQSSSF